MIYYIILCINKIIKMLRIPGASQKDLQQKDLQQKESQQKYSQNFEVTVISNKDFAQTNKIYFNSLQGIPQYIKLNGDLKSFVFATDIDTNIKPGCIALNGRQREDCGKNIGDNLNFEEYTNHFYHIKLMLIKVDTTAKIIIDCEEMTNKMKKKLGIIPLTCTQSIVFLYKGTSVTMTIESIEYDEIGGDNNNNDNKIGLFDENTAIMYVSDKKYINLSNQSSGGIFKTGMNLSSLSVGGLGKEFEEIFVKAFISRVRPDISAKLGIKHTKGILLHGPPGCGKCLGINTPVLMYDGTIKMVQDIVIGDKLMGDDSTERVVLSLARGKEQMYKIKQEDGDDYIVNESHILSMRMSKPKKLKKTKTSYKISYFSQKEFVYRKKTFNFKDYANKDEAFKHATETLNDAENVDIIDIGLKKYLNIQRDPRRALKGYKVSVSFEKQILKYDPYITGLLLAHHNVITENTKLDCDDLDKINNACGGDIIFKIDESVETTNDDHLETLSMKSIPHINKCNSKKARIRLLAGIIDLKGDLYKRTYRFSTKNEEFAKDVIFICRSLGFVCTSNKVILPNSQYIRVKFTGNLVTKMPCLIERNITTKIVKEDLNTIITVEKLGIDDYYGFEISGNRRFLLGDFTVTHNTLLAREMSKLLDCVEPKIVSGPELLNRYHGQSEENVRNLFADAFADKSGKQLHVIIFDEFDALCKARGSAGSNGLGDNIVNQLLSMIDGPKELNNVLIICMTNRKDLMDEAVLRAGRIELHIEIQLPDEKGRFEILNIHTKSMKENAYLCDDVNIYDIAKITENYTGAELAKVAKDASSYALSREITITDGKVSTSKKINPMVTLGDFYRAVNEIVPMFGRASGEIQLINSTPFIFWTPTIRDMHNEIIEKILSLKCGNLSTILIHGKSYIGKTKFIANMIKETGIPCVKMITADKIIRSVFKSAYITNIYESCSKASTSILILDGFERIIEWLRLGPRFNNEILQTIVALLTAQIKPTKKMIIICTANNDNLYNLNTTVLDELGVSDLFDTKYEYPDLISADEIKINFPVIYEKLNITDTSVMEVSNIFKLMKYI